jgi:hypothetical protein
MTRDLDYQQRADQPRARSWLSVTLVSLTGLAVAWLLLRASWVPFSGNESLFRAEVERLGQFQFPPGATEIATNYVGMQDPTLQVRFNLPSGEFDQFVRSAKLDPPLSSTSIPSDIAHPGPTKPWWKPGQPSVFQAGESTTQALKPRRAVHKAVLIDQSNPQTFTVWLVAYRPI